VENLIAHWPSGWGNDFQVLLYGDFDPPGADLEFENLGIRVLHEPVETQIIKGATTVLAAKVTVAERSVDGILDATRRLNILLGAWTLVTWSNVAVGWWSYITHSHGGGTKESLDHADLPAAVEGIAKLPDSIRPKVDAALFWVREPQRMMREGFRPNLLGRYAAYWNAFECLVDAINHGDVDAENLDEQLRIDSRISRLWMIVWGMFGRLIPFPAPVDRPLEDTDGGEE